MPPGLWRSTVTVGESAAATTLIIINIICCCHSVKRVNRTWSTDNGSAVYMSATLVGERMPVHGGIVGGTAVAVATDATTSSTNVCVPKISYQFITALPHHPAIDWLVSIAALPPLPDTDTATSTLFVIGVLWCIATHAFYKSWNKTFNNVLTFQPF